MAIPQNGIDTFGNSVTNMVSGIWNTVSTFITSNVGRPEVDETVPYTVDNTFDDGIELRTYPARNWVCTHSNGDPFEGSSGSMFWKLFRYIQGNNDASQSIDMTAPVTTLVKPISGSQEKYMEMCFYVGSSAQENPPTPTDDQVYVKFHEERKVYTRKVSGYMSGQDWRKEVEDLANKLNQMGIDHQSGSYYKVGYDSPMKLFNRRNEVWYVAN